MCQWKTFILFIAMVSCVTQGGKKDSEGANMEQKREVKRAHQVGQDDFDWQEMPRGVQQDAPVREPGKVADGRCIDAFLRTKTKSASVTSHKSENISRILRISYGAIVVLVNQLAESFQAYGEQFR